MGKKAKINVILMVYKQTIIMYKNNIRSTKKTKIFKLLT